MPASKSQKTDDKDNAESWRVDQRRLRNRLSQKAVRERRVARIKQLEQHLETINKECDNTRTLELLDSNAKLRDALLDTRRKLASLSATAITLGDRLKAVLDEKDDCEQISGEAQPYLDLFDDHSYLQEKSAESCSQSSHDSSTELMAQPEHSKAPTTHSMSLAVPAGVVDSVAGYLCGAAAQVHAEHLEHFAEADIALTAVSNIDQVFDIHTGPEVMPPLRVCPPSAFSEHLDCIQNLLKLSGLTNEHARYKHALDSMVSAFLSQAWPSMQYWFSATRSFPLGASVLRWQTSRTDEAATQVPTGNAPTLIQLSRRSYPSILDWVPHPGLRNLLILNHETYDVDQVVCDMTAAYVVEVEETIFRRRALEAACFSPSSSMTDRSYSYNLMELVHRTLLTGNPGIHNEQDLTAMSLLRDTDSSTWTALQHPIHRFKIDASFFDKYPALYDSNAVSNFALKHPVFASEMQRPCPFTTESVKVYMKTLMQSKNAVR